MSAFLVYTIIFVPEPRPSDKTRKIHEAFLIAEKHIDSQDKLPSKTEMDRWFKSYQGPNQYVEMLLFRSSTDRKSLPGKLGEIPPGSYQLAFWRSEWMEEYAPWSGESTMCDIEKNCNSFSSLRLPLIIFTALGIYLLWGFRQLKTATGESA